MRCFYTFDHHTARLALIVLFLTTSHHSHLLLSLSLVVLSLLFSDVSIQPFVGRGDILKYSVDLVCWGVSINWRIGIVQIIVLNDVVFGAYWTHQNGFWSTISHSRGLFDRTKFISRSTAPIVLFEILVGKILNSGTSGGKCSTLNEDTTIAISREPLNIPSVARRS